MLVFVLYICTFMTRVACLLSIGNWSVSQPRSGEPVLASTDPNIPSLKIGYTSITTTSSPSFPPSLPLHLPSLPSFPPFPPSPSIFPLSLSLSPPLLMHTNEKHHSVPYLEAMTMSCSYPCPARVVWLGSIFN